MTDRLLLLPLLLGLMACASAPKGPGEGQVEIRGRLQVSVDPRLDTWDLVPGSQSKFAQLQLCPADAEGPRALRGCDDVATDREGHIAPGSAVTLPATLGPLRFEMPSRQSASRVGPRLTLTLDPELIQGTYLRYGWSEDLLVNIPASGDLTPPGGADIQAVDLGAWHLALLPDNGLPLACPEGQIRVEVTPPSPPSDWFIPLLCVAPPDAAPGVLSFVPGAPASG